ncbi:MAG: DEAD/DEAH box helicase [Alphaproteobacteria bacterium]|nr:DEAD/DEAH box helicase [Alphaproteobacteria bacterium]
MNGSGKKTVKKSKTENVTTFTELGLNDNILKAIDDVGYTTPTPIQEQAIPYVLQMRDVLGCAQTGTGKTASFTLPMIEMMASGRARARMPRSLILEPTRELATQVADNFKLYGKYHPGLSMALLIGGENMEPQIKNLERGVDLLIATPGRLIDLFERGRIMPNDIKIFVIDEADRMLDMGFIPDIEKIAGRLPAMRQTLLFSATMPPEIRKLANKFLSNPKEVTVSPPSSASVTINHSLIDLPSGNDWQKREALRHLLRQEDVLNAFIFCNRKRDVALLQKSLAKHGFNAGALHGDLDQSTRTETLDSFKSGSISLLVCSDVAARGLDIADVSHVFNFDVPFNAEDYIHRIGRTGRAGKTGTAVTLVTPDEAKLITAIETLIKKEIQRGTIDGLPEPDMAQSRRARPSSASSPARTPRGRRPRDESKPRYQKSTGEVYVSPRPVPHPDSTPASVVTSHDAPEGPHAFGDSLPAFLRRPRTVAKRSS